MWRTVNVPLALVDLTATTTGAVWLVVNDTGAALTAPYRCTSSSHADALAAKLNAQDYPPSP